MARQVFERAVLHTPDQITPEQSRFEEIAKEKGYTSTSQMTWQQSHDIMQQVRNEMNGGRTSEKASRWDLD